MDKILKADAKFEAIHHEETGILQLDLQIKGLPTVFVKKIVENQQTLTPYFISALFHVIGPSLNETEAQQVIDELSAIGGVPPVVH